MDNIIKKLSEIEQSASAIVTHAEAEKVMLEQQIQSDRNVFDEKLEKETQNELDEIREGLERQMSEILTRQKRKNASEIEKMQKDFAEKHSVYAEEVVRQIIEG